MAGLTSWLCLKADAIMRRDKPKDAYDVVWVIAALGPEAAAGLVASSPLLVGTFATEVRMQLRRLREQFKTTDAVGPRAYADFFQQPGLATARRFAVGTLERLWTTLEVLIGPV